MESLSRFQLQKRAFLRGRCEKAASDLLRALYCQPSASYTSDDLSRLGVSLATFDPGDPGFLQSEACLFEPFEEMGQYVLKEDDLDENEKESLIYPRAYLLSTANEPYPSHVALQATDGIVQHLETLYDNLKRKDGKCHLKDVSGWRRISEDNSFLDGSIALYHGGPVNIPPWQLQALREWKGSEDANTMPPHVLLMISNGTTAKDGELLFSELGPLTQTIQNRLRQSEFEKTSLFPVLVISFFAPRHGRLLQAKFSESGTLEVRASRVYNFQREEDAPFDLFLRYYFSKPQDGLEYEFYIDKEATPATLLQKHISPTRRSDKENIPLKSVGEL